MSTYDLNDIKYYLDGCGEILGENITDEDTPLPEKNDELIQTLGKSLNDIFFALRRREEEASWGFGRPSMRPASSKSMGKHTGD